MPKSIYSSDALEGANYSSIRTQGNNLYRRAKFKDALHSYDSALMLNPRSKTIMLEKSKCHVQMGDVDKALADVDHMYGSREVFKRPAPTDWRGGGGGGGGTKTSNYRQVNNNQESLGDLSYKCRYLLNKADALYNKGDFEDALVLYHKGLRLRPKAPEFKLGISKSEDALKVMFEKKEKQTEQKKKEEQRRQSKQILPEQKDKSKKETKENEENVDIEKQEKAEKQKQDREPPDKESNKTDRFKDKQTEGEKKGNSEFYKSLLVDQEKEQREATASARRERRNEVRLQFAAKAREEARKMREQQTTDDTQRLLAPEQNVSEKIPSKRSYRLLTDKQQKDIEVKLMERRAKRLRKDTRLIAASVEREQAKKTKEKTNLEPKSENKTTVNQPKSKKLLTDHQKEKIKATIAERKERIRAARISFSVKEREEARKIRAKYTSRPSGHLNDDLEFLRMIYKNLKDQTVKNRKVQRITKDAIGYIDTRSNFWNQQIPHHIREKSHVVQMPKGKTPPPTQAMFAFVIKETIRINSMMEKTQWNRAIESAKKLIEHIGKMERKIPNRESVIANIFSLIGNAYLELGDDKKALAFHLKDLHLSSEFDLDEAKSRSMDNVGRVYARIGEFEKAVAVWGEKVSSDLIVTTLGERAWIYHEMGYCYMEIDQAEQAKECGDKSYEAATEDNNAKWQLNAKLLTAQALLRMGEAYESKEKFEGALVMATEADDKEAQTKINSALKEINDVLAEWEYMDSEEEDDPSADQDDNQEEEISKDLNPTPKEEHQHDHDPHIDLPIQKPRKSSVYTHGHDDAKPTWLLDVEEEHKAEARQKQREKHNNIIEEESEEEVIEEEAENKSILNTDNSIPILLAPDDDSPVTVVYLGSARKESEKDNDSLPNPSLKKTQGDGNFNKVSTKPPKVDVQAKSKKTETSKKTQSYKETISKDPVKKPTVKEPIRGQKPKQEGSNVPTKGDTAVQKPRREGSNVSGRGESSVQTPKREKSNSSIFVKKASRENSNASLNKKITKEGSFTKTPPKREASNQSMKGKISREGSYASRQSMKQEQVQETSRNQNETFQPRITNQEETVAIYASTSRENSIISKRANAKPPRETSLLTKSIANIKSSNGSSTILTKPPSRDEKRHNEMVIDVVAALNDPKKNNGETEQDHAFITEKTTLTESTVAAVEKS